MNEGFVSLEVAGLLKEKGFDCPCATLYMAQKWLRKEKGIYIWVEPVVGRKWTTSSCDFNVSLEESDWIERELHKDGYPVYNTYEEALQTGILEILNLI